MSQRGEEWAARLNAAIGAEVRKHRIKKEWSVQRVSDEIEARHGVTIKRPVLSNLEHGRRPTIASDELFVLADVLDVAPLLLLFPLGRLDSVEVLPGVEVTPWEAMQWAEGGGALNADEIELYGGGAVHLFREHARGVKYWRDAGRAIERAEQLLADEETPASDAATIRIDRDRFVVERAGFVDKLREVRAAMRSSDPQLRPPRLPLGLRYLDEEDQP